MVNRFLRIESASGIVLLAAAVAALVWANSAWSDSYHELLDERINSPLLDLTIHEVINDGLMAIFFFLVGLEIKREFVAGELRGFKAAALPIAAAVGGMAVPALIYYVLESGTPGERGWGIPMATDIAFAVGVLSLLGSRVPKALSVFLLAFAIADDLGAIAVIAIFYTDDLNITALLLGCFGLFSVFLLQRAGIRTAPLYVLFGVMTWFAFYESGVHPTIAGVALAFLTPMPGISRIEDRLHRLVAFGIMPLFALANAGVTFHSDILSDAVSSSVAMSVAIALLVGKPIGIVLASWVTSTLGYTRLPTNCSWGHMLGVGVLGGIGFTVALFIADLSFTSPEILDASKLGILGGSTAAAILGLLILTFVIRKSPTGEISKPRL